MAAGSRGRTVELVRTHGAAPVAQTKLAAPPSPITAVWADGLVERLAEQVRSARLTLLRADGGTGKTTLARALIEELGLPWGWVTLDAHDDLTTTVDLVTTALTQALPELAIEFDEVATLSGPEAAHRTAVAIANVLADGNKVVSGRGPADVVLVADDLHEVPDPDVVRFLAELVDAAPPSFRLIVTTRTRLQRLGGARAVAKGDAIEVDAELLRVTPHVARRISAGLGHDLDEEAATALVDRCGGWVLGVRLLAASASEGTGPPVVGHAGTDLVRRWVDEEIVLGRDPSEVADLEAIAVLDVVTEEAVARMLGADDPRGWLRRLQDQQPLLTVGLGPATVRLHDLFREALMDRLAGDPERLAAAHRAAAAVVPTWQAQVDHWLAAGDETAAAKVLAEQARAVFPRMAPLAQVGDAITHLSDVTLAAWPWLRVVVGVVEAQRRVSRRAIEWLEPALMELAPDDLLGRWAACRYAQLSGTDVPRWTGELLALEQMAGFDDLPPSIRAEHHIGIAHAMHLAGRPDEAAAHHDSAITIARSTRDTGAIEVLAQHTSPFLVQLDGGVARVRAWADWVEGEITAPSPLARYGGYCHRTLVALMTGNIDTVLAESVSAAPLSERVDAAWLRPLLDWALVSAWFARGDLTPAADLLQALRREPSPIAAGWFGPLARILAAQEDLSALHALHVDAGSLAPRHGTTAGPALGSTAVARAELARAEGRTSEAVTIMEEAIGQLGGLVLLPSVGRLQLDLVVALESDGRHDDALALLLDELVLLKRKEMVGLVACRGRALLPILERAIAGALQLEAAKHAQAVLSGDNSPTPIDLPGGQTLSPREVEILRLVAAGHSNPEIAEDLVISVNTVKTHVRNLLAKLGVSSRAAAATRAVQIGLGDPKLERLPFRHRADGRSKGSGAIR